MNILSHIRFFPKKYGIALVLLCVVAFVIYLGVRGDDENSFETYNAERRDVILTIDETGVVESAQEALLSFRKAGQIASVNAKEGDVVTKGEILAVLENSEEWADVLSARADVEVAEAELADVRRSSDDSGGTSLALVKQRQERLVENAYITLLSEGLVVEPSKENYTHTAPIITGRYTGPEGVYKIILRRGNQFNEHEMSLFNLETVRDVEIRETGPTPLGTHGLYIAFPDTLSTYADTIWYLTIPNTESAEYVANYNAYQAARDQRDVTIDNARANNDDVRAEEARLNKARAGVTRAEVAYGNTTLRAPFNGVVASLEVSMGESVTSASEVMSLITDAEYEITVPVPEADIAYADRGDRALVTFDAYDEVVFDAEISAIAPSAKTVEGVPVFDMTLQFTQHDPRIKKGLSADVEIVAEERMDVLAIPGRALIRTKEGASFVRVFEEGEVTERSVTTGLRSSDGFIEITEGIEEGDTVITFIDEETLSELTSSSYGTL